MGLVFRITYCGCPVSLGVVVNALGKFPKITQVEERGRAEEEEEFLEDYEY